jgi:hypothetical protein
MKEYNRGSNRPPVYCYVEKVEEAKENGKS